MEYEHFLFKLANGKTASEALEHVASVNKRELTLDLDTLQDDAKRQETARTMQNAYWG
jgi:hypothetical protein